jgi:hypothetical protein
MEIQTLRLFLSEQEANDLIVQHQPPDLPVKNLRVRFTPEGARVSGEYPTLLMTMPFDSLWQLGAAGGRVEARLIDLSAGGMSAGPMRKVVLHALGGMLAEPGVSVSDDAVLLDVPEMVRRRKLPLRLDFVVRAVRCVEGGVVLEAGWPASE